jgi:hypothetical protein
MLNFNLIYDKNILLMSAIIKTKHKDFTLRFAEENDSGLILEFIKKLADYEKRLHEVSAEESNIKESLFITTQHFLENRVFISKTYLLIKKCGEKVLARLFLLFLQNLQLKENAEEWNGVF